jgi:hypothetical protein
MGRLIIPQAFETKKTVGFRVAHGPIISFIFSGSLGLEPIVTPLHTGYPPPAPIKYLYIQTFYHNYFLKNYK